MAQPVLTVDQTRTLLALALATDRQGVINLLQLNGIDIGSNSTNKQIGIAFIKAIKDSESFRTQTADYLENYIRTQGASFIGDIPHKPYRGGVTGHYAPFVKQPRDIIDFGSPKDTRGFVDQIGASDLDFVTQPRNATLEFFGKKIAGSSGTNPLNKTSAVRLSAADQFFGTGTMNFVEEPGADVFSFVTQPRNATLELMGKTPRKKKRQKNTTLAGQTGGMNDEINFAGDRPKKVHIKRNFVEQPRDIIDFVNQPQDIMAYAGSPKKMRGGFLNEDGPTITITPPDATDDSGDSTPIAQPFNPNSLGIENPGTAPVGTVVGPSQVTLQAASANPQAVAAAQAATGQSTATGVAAPAGSGGSFLSNLFSASNTSAILKTGLNAYSTSLTASANQTSEQNALALEQYKLAQAQQAGINAGISTWPAWATVVIAVAGIAAIALVIRKMNKNKKAKAAAAAGG